MGAELRKFSDARLNRLEAAVIACPNCNRRVFTRRDMLYATLDGAARCRFCGRAARLDLMSRWLFACVLAIVLPTLYLYAGVFYSGHLFLISIFVILGAWGMLSFVGFPLLTLEVAGGGSAIDRRTSMLILAVVQQRSLSTLTCALDSSNDALGYG